MIGGADRALLVIVVYQSEFQHRDLDTEFTGQHSMRPAGSRDTEPVNTRGIADRLATLARSSPDEFHRLTSETGDVVHLEHLRLVRERHAGMDLLLVGSRSTPAGPNDTEALAERLASVADRELGSSLGRSPVLPIDFGAVTSLTDKSRKDQRRALHTELDKLAAPHGIESAPWDRCYASVRGPAWPWLDGVLAPVLPRVVPLYTLDRRYPGEPVRVEFHPRHVLRDGAIVQNLIATRARAERVDAHRVADLVIQEARAQLRLGLSTADREMAEKLVRQSEGGRGR